MLAKLKKAHIISGFLLKLHRAKGLQVFLMQSMAENAIHH